MDYTPSSLSETPEITLNHYTYPQHPTTHQTTSEYTYTEQPAPSVVPDNRSSSGAAQSASRRSLPSGQSSLGGGTTSATMNAQTSSWQPMPNTSIAAAAPTRRSPRQSRAKQPTPVSQAYDDLRQQASSWATANQSAPQTTQPKHTSPPLAAAQPARARSRQSNRAQSNTPVNSMPAARQVQPQGGQSRAGNSGYAPTPTAAQPSNSAQNYNNYNQYSSGNTEANTADRISYQPYASNPTPVQSSSYQSFDNYNSRVANTSPTLSTLPAPGPQNVASSYPADSAATTTSNTSQWGAASSTSQARNTRASGGTSYNMPSTSQPSQSLQEFNVRPQPQAQARSSSSMYSQQPQQQQ